MIYHCPQVRSSIFPQHHWGKFQQCSTQTLVLFRQMAGWLPAKWINTSPRSLPTKPGDSAGESGREKEPCFSKQWGPQLVYDMGTCVNYPRTLLFRLTNTPMISVWVYVVCVCVSVFYVTLDDPWRFVFLILWRKGGGGSEEGKKEFGFKSGYHNIIE